MHCNPTTLATSTVTTPDTITTVINTIVPPVSPPSGGDSPAATFTVTEDATTHAVTFGGTATGVISVAWAGAVGNSVAIFTRGGLTATADFATGDSITLGSGQTLTDIAADLTGLTINGAGTVNVTALESTPSANFSLITTTTKTATLALSNNTVDFTGNFGATAVTVTGTAGGAVDTLNTEGATLGTASFNLDANSHMNASSTKFHANGNTVTGTGTLAIGISIAVNLDNVADSVNVIGATGTVDVTGFGTLAKVDSFAVLNTKTLTISAAQANGKAITNSDGGSAAGAVRIPLHVPLTCK